MRIDANSLFMFTTDHSPVYLSRTRDVSRNDMQLSRKFPVGLLFTLRSGPVRLRFFS